MTMGLGHFPFGAAMTTIVVTYLLPTVWYPRSVVLAGGGWAMLPDAHWISPVANDALHELHRTSPWTDVFWFHRTMDRLDPTDSMPIAAALLACFIVVTILAERRDYRAPAMIKDAYPTPIDPEPPDKA